jgi:hypothetical protein
MFRSFTGATLSTIRKIAHFLSRWRDYLTNPPSVQRFVDRTPRKCYTQRAPDAIERLVSHLLSADPLRHSVRKDTMTNADLIAEIRVQRLLNLDRAHELEEQVLGQSIKAPSKTERKEDAAAALGLLL